MAIATGAGAEVQRRLATAVVAGMILSIGLTLVVLPGILTMALRGYRRTEPELTEGGLLEEQPAQ